MFNTENSAIICIDIQEKLTNMLKNKENIEKNATIIMKTADILNIKTIITEQYPKGLGETIADIKNISNFKTIEKTSFSALKTIEFQEELKKLNVENILIFGIETHICVLQSVIDLLKEKFNVYVISDCCASRLKTNHKTALKLMEAKGAFIISSEIALFNFLKGSKHPNFKEIQALIK